MNELVYCLIEELATRDYKSLVDEIKTTSYEVANDKLHGFNHQDEVSGENGFHRGESFDFNYKSLNGTIYRSYDGGCELYKTFDLWIDNLDISTPLAKVEFNDDDEVSKIEYILDINKLEL